MSRQLLKTSHLRSFLGTNGSHFCMGSLCWFMNKFEQLTAQCRQISSELEELGVLVNENSRFHKHIEYILSVNEIHQTTKKYDYSKGFALYKLFYAMQEIQELIYIREHLIKNLSFFSIGVKAKIIEKLNFIVDGEQFTEDEKITEPRNIQFELFMAACLFARGYRNIDFFERPDVAVTINGRVYGFECKRVTGSPIKRLVPNVNKAANQLANSVIPLYAGVVAIDFSFLTQKNMWTFDTTKAQIEQKIIRTLYEWGQHIVARSKFLKRYADEQVIVGMSLRLAVPYIVEDSRDVGSIIAHVNPIFTNNSLSETYGEDLKDFLNMRIE